MSNYVETTMTRLDELIPGNETDLIRLYALLVHVKGTATSLEDVHDAWSLWRDQTAPTHKSLIPFEDLTVEIQEYDREYRDAIRQVAGERV